MATKRDIKAALKSFLEITRAEALGVLKAGGDYAAAHRLVDKSYNGRELSWLYRRHEEWQCKFPSFVNDFSPAELLAKKWTGFSAKIEGEPTSTDEKAAFKEAVEDLYKNFREKLVFTRHQEEEEKPREAEPFRYIGYNQTHYFFLKGAQRIPYSIPMGRFSVSQIQELAPPEYWGRLDCIGDKGGIEIQRAQAIIVQAETERGYFRPEILRGSGVWEDDGEIIVNTGESIIYQDGTELPLDKYDGPFAYTRSDIRFSALEGQQASAKDGQALEKLFYAQGFMSRRATIAALGWALISPFAGVLSWRPHIWVTGQTGSGKSFFLEHILSKLCGDYSYTGTGRSTEPGIRRSINMVPCPVILDEMTPKNKTSKENITKLVELARNSCGESSGRSTFASGAESTVSYITRSPFCFASVNVPDEGEEISNRFIHCELIAPVGTPAKQAKIEKSSRYLAAAMSDPASYRRRIFRALPRIIDDIKRLHSFLPAFLGGQRSADVWAPLLAAAWAVQSDESIFSPAGDVWISATLNEAKEAGPDYVSDEDRVIEHILGAMVESDDRKKKTVAEWILIASKGTSDEGYMYAEDLIARHGLRIMAVKGQRVLAVATSSDALARLLRDTPYEAGYDAQIKRNPLCINREKPMRENLAGKLTNCRLLEWAGFKAAYLEGGE